MKDFRLAIVTTHPIQYYAPLFRLLSENNTVKVFYSWGKNSLRKFDPGFGKVIEWDTPLLNDYKYEFLENTSKNPGSHHFNGIVNEDGIIKISNFKPHAILIFGWAYHSHLKIIRHFKNKVPVWFRGDSTLLDDQAGIKSLVKTIFLKWVYSHIDLVFYVGTNNKFYFKKYGIDERKLVFAPHAIDNERFAVDHRDDAKILREALGMRESDLLILFAGKFEEKKDPLLLLEAFKQLEREDVHLLFVGNGELEGKMKEEAFGDASGTDASTTLSMTSSQTLDALATLSMGKGRMHFMDFQNQSRMPVIYKACDLFCLPSKGPGETWGLAINEAMASGKAVLVSSKVGCKDDLINPGINGDIFLSGDIENLYLKLSLLLNMEILDNMGKNSKQIIKKFNFQMTSNTILEELRQL